MKNEAPKMNAVSKKNVGYSESLVSGQTTSVRKFEALKMCAALMKGGMKPEIQSFGVLMRYVVPRMNVVPRTNGQTIYVPNFEVSMKYG